MSASELLREARRHAHLTQRELAERTGVPQASIARMEGGTTVPRFDTLERLLDACGVEIRTVARPDGIDRSLIRARLAMTPWERHLAGAAAANALIALRRAPLRPQATAEP
jgi:transcriptional regulator with XRE-family HTH domain